MEGASDLRNASAGGLAHLVCRWSISAPQRAARYAPQSATCRAPLTLAASPTLAPTATRALALQWLSAVVPWTTLRQLICPLAAQLPMPAPRHASSTAPCCQKDKRTKAVDCALRCQASCALRYDHRTSLPHRQSRKRNLRVAQHALAALLCPAARCSAESVLKRQRTPRTA